jgi:hypothetical protein
LRKRKIQGVVLTVPVVTPVVHLETRGCLLKRILDIVAPVLRRWVQVAWHVGAVSVRPMKTGAGTAMTVVVRPT